MAPKLTAKQLVRLTWLNTLPPKMAKIHKAIELLAGQRVDETVARTTTRLLGELKSQASTLGITSLGENFGYMETLLRRGGGRQMKVRGLREMLAGAKVNLEGEHRAASTPENQETEPGGEPSSP
jgi:hypothetical protein